MAGSSSGRRSQYLAKGFEQARAAHVAQVIREFLEAASIRSTVSACRTLPILRIDLFAEGNGCAPEKEDSLPEFLRSLIACKGIHRIRRV